MREPKYPGEPWFKRIKAKPTPPPAFTPGLKYEPAGKVRLFAMLDSISQRLLLPLHEWVMEVLRRIPQDGTFAQLRPLRNLKGDLFWSLDLKSATDRFPVFVQLLLLKSLFGATKARGWRSLLTTRSFTMKVPLTRTRTYVKSNIDSEGKSWESNSGSYEFAHRFIWRGIDLSPISFAFVHSARLTALSVPPTTKVTGVPRGLLVRSLCS